MHKRLDGLLYYDLIESGIKSLFAHKKILNDLNVFPVPDGDTGTNMVMTLKYGFDAVGEKVSSLTEVATTFAKSAVFGARGNSGVIVSQFVKGMSEKFEGLADVDCFGLAAALTNGYERAYNSVAKPVEGTILTVLRDAAVAVKERMPLDSVEELISVYLCHAKTSLEKTPELLPVLKKAGVVDSGASGIVYFFDGILKFLNGEEIESTKEKIEVQTIDFSQFDKNTSFEYGYCVEGLVQLKIDENDFDIEEFKSGLDDLGESVVATLEHDKIKLHIHAKTLGGVMDYVQSVGEFLTIKIENMSVQNAQQNRVSQKILRADEENLGDFSVVAVAPNSFMQQKLFEMGADVVIRSEIAPSSQEFIQAFEMAEKKDIIVFPNCSNSIMTCKQAAELFDEGRVKVVNSHSVAECYACLSIIDFDGDVCGAEHISNQTIENILQAGVYRATKDFKYGSKQVEKGEYFSVCQKAVVSYNKDIVTVSAQTVKALAKQKECNVLTLFYGGNVNQEKAEKIKQQIEELEVDFEVGLVSTFESSYSVLLIFE